MGEFVFVGDGLDSFGVLSNQLVVKLDDSVVAVHSLFGNGVQSQLEHLFFVGDLLQAIVFLV